MHITKRQKDIIFDIFNKIDLDLQFDNEKSIAVLTDFIDNLFGASKPNDYEYNINYQHYSWIINVVFDYLMKQNREIEELKKLSDEYYKILHKSEKIEQ